MTINFQKYCLGSIMCNLFLSAVSSEVEIIFKLFGEVAFRFEKKWCSDVNMFLWSWVYHVTFLSAHSKFNSETRPLCKFLWSCYTPKWDQTS